MGCDSSREAGGALLTQTEIRNKMKPEVLGSKNIKYHENRAALSPKSVQLQPPTVNDTVPVEATDASIKSIIEKRSILSSLDHELLVKKISLLDKKTLVDLLLGTDLVASTDACGIKCDEEHKDESKAVNEQAEMKVIEPEPEIEHRNQISLINVDSTSSENNQFDVNNNNAEVSNVELKSEEIIEVPITVDSPNNTVTTSTNSRFKDDVKKKIKQLALISKELVGETVLPSSSSNVKHFADVVNVTKAPLKFLNRRNKALALSNNSVNTDETKIADVETVDNAINSEAYNAQRILLSARPSSSIDYLSSSSEFIKPNRDNALYDYGGSRAMPYEVTIDSNYHNSVGNNCSNIIIESRNYGNSTKGSVHSSGYIANSIIRSSKNTDNLENFDLKANTYPISKKTEDGNDKSLNTSIDGGNSRFNEYSRLIQLTDAELYEEYTKCAHLVNAGTTFNSKHELCLGIVKCKFQDRLIIQKKSSVIVVDNVIGSNTDDELVISSNSSGNSNIDANKFIDKAYLFSKNVDNAHDTLRNSGDNNAVGGSNKVTVNKTDDINRNINSSISAKQKSLSIQNNVNTNLPAIAKTGSSFNKVKKVIVNSESDRNRVIMLKKRDNFIPDKLTPLFPSNNSNTTAKDSHKNATTTVPKKIQQLLLQKGKFGVRTPGDSADSKKPKSKLEGSMLSPIAVDNTSSPNYISY